MFWNTSQMAVEPAGLAQPDGSHVIKYQNGLFELLKRTITVSDSQYIVAGLIPLHWQYFIENKYLHAQFATFNGIDKLYELTGNKSGVGVKNAAGTTLFYIVPKRNVHIDQPDAISITLRLVTILLLLFFFSIIAKELNHQVSFFHGLVFLVGVLLLFRLIIYYSPFPFYLNVLDLFVPSPGDRVIFSTSLGDLLLNLVLMFQVVSFIFFYRTQPAFLKPWHLQVLAVVFLTLQVLLTILFCDVVKSLIYNYGVSFDVNNFFNLSSYTITGLIILAVFIICYYYFSWLMVLPSLQAGFSLFKRIVISAVAGLLILSFLYTFGYLNTKNSGGGMACRLAHHAAIPPFR